MGIAFGGGVDHGASHLAQGADVVGSEQAQDGIESADHFVVAVDILLAAGGAHETGAEIVGVLESAAEEGIFGASFDAGPHDAAFLGAVGEGSGDIDEGHVGIDGAEGFGEAERGVVGEVVVEGFAHAAGTDAGTEKAGVVAGQLVVELVELKEVGNDELAEMRVAAGRGAAVDHEDAFDSGIVEAFEKNAFADHAGRAGDDDPELSWGRHSGLGLIMAEFDAWVGGKPTEF